MLGDKILEMLKEEIPQKEYERYIKNLSYDEKSSKADLAVYIAPNIFIANWVKNRYTQKLSHLFETHTGIKTDIKILTGKKEVIKKETKSAEPQTPSTTSTKINPPYTFENFVVGSSNQFAYTAALSVAEKPGKVYNPLFIYGGVGLGKTHLLHAIGNYNIKEKTVIYATIEQFMNDFIYHLRNHNPEGFREKYRKCDILLIDDIQFLSGKDKTQEEFFHTFNELHTEGKQIVLTSDQHPKKIAGLEERLKSRFEWGLIADIQPPELETKIAIIKKKCELNRIELDEEIINYLAANMDSNIREIEGVILKLNAYSTLVGQKITLDLAKNVLSEQKKDQQKNITLQDIVQVVASDLNVKPSEIKSKSRNRQIANARRMVIYLARTLTPNSMPALAQFFGMKDHTSVSHAMKKVKELIEKDADFKLKIEELAHKIKSNASEQS
ncbi:MAG: chromosomal replication initiator protein DnaA [Epsilonproteobacteria bacterium]|nr:chromosomal replication initiator protein DnaA [Campylobacterota bacterium]NPA64434.1 chromosomal replication initiator protein DnaA [Campylobacterota bacterium]